MAEKEAGLGGGGVGEQRAEADAGLRACIIQRSKSVGKGASRKMVAVAGVCSRRRRLVRTSGAPPPRARTRRSRPRAEARAADSSRRKRRSPWVAKMEGTVRPARDSM
jgi:hypothetical protein